MINVGDLVMDEYFEKGIITDTKNWKNNGYVEVTFFGGLYGIVVCEVNQRFLTTVSRINKRKKNEET